MRVLPPIVVTVITVVCARLAYDAARAAYAQDSSGNYLGAALLALAALALLGVVAWLFRPFWVLARLRARPA